jgi:hypothetical protein
LRLRGQYDEAEPSFKEVIEGRQAKIGQKKPDDAEPLLRQGYEGMEKHELKIPKRDKERLTQALERLVQLYDSWGKPDKAAAWRQKQNAKKSSE